MEEKKWRFGVVGNIVSEHTDENGNVYYGTKAFTPSTKVYIDGIQIGTADFAFEDIVCERVDAEQHERLLWMDTCIDIGMRATRRIIGCCDNFVSRLMYELKSEIEILNNLCRNCSC